LSDAVSIVSLAS